MAAHYWVRAPRHVDRVRARSELALPPTLAVVNAHRRLRGPYTAVGTLLRQIVPDALDSVPDLVIRHNIEVLTTTPELRGVVPATRETLTSLAVPQERTRFYSRLRTLRIAHGLVDFLADYLRGIGPRALVVDDVHEADPTDREFLAVLLRRIDPARLTVVITTGTGPLTEPAGPIAVPLEPALETYCVRVDGAASISTDRTQSYVDSDGTSDDPAAIAAYQELDSVERALLHDARADELAARGEPSLVIGAIPYHRERGTDPHGAGVQALREALDKCVDHCFYHAVVDFGTRGRALVGHDTDLEQWWNFTTRMTTALAALGRPEDALLLYDDVRTQTTSPSIHMQAAYATAMLHTRHFEPEQRDHVLARAWANEAIAIANILPDNGMRAFNSAFNQNGLALIEFHQGNPAAALALLDDCLASLHRELAPDEHALHRSVLRYNRAQILAALKQFTAAVADYTTVIELDPNYAEYYFDRGALLRRLGRNEDALADYESAIRLSPPFPEAYYNRGDLLAELGDVDGALADFSYTLELDPDFLDAYVNRAGLRLSIGDLDGAMSDAEAGLARDPDNPHLHVVLGQVYTERERFAEAQVEFDRALGVDPDLVTGLASRAALACQTGRPAVAISDLGRAVELAPDDATLLFNRAFAYQSDERWDEALVDLDRALALAPGDPDILAARELCLGRVPASSGR
jgi:tetratricopeptide (TPR) repeat protein